MSISLIRHPKLLIGTAALMLAGAANAEISLYGLVDLSVGKNEYIGDQKVDFHSGGDSGSSQGNSTTRVGLKASNEVAPGIKVNANFETAGITSDGSVGGAGTPFFNRQAWAGVSGSFGEVRLGKQDSVVFQTQAPLDFNGAANAASAFLAAGAAAWLPGRQDRSLQYISPNLSGLKVQVGLQPKGNSVATGPAAPKTNYSIGATFVAGPVTVAAAAESKRTEGGEDFASVAGSYDFGVAKVMASYSDAGAVVGKGIGLGVIAPVAGFNVGLNFGRNSDTKNKAVEVFVNREIYKNVIVYTDLGHFDNKVAGDPIYGLPVGKYNAYAIGAIYVF
jgi:predicted porin